MKTDIIRYVSRRARQTGPLRPSARALTFRRIGRAWGAALCLISLASVAAAACPSVPTPTRFVMSSDGSEVTDLSTHLIWARCSVGQVWDNSQASCAGKAIALRFADALSQAQAAGWRLPEVNELFSLIDVGCQLPALDGAAFPATTAQAYWTTTPYSDYALSAWIVDFSQGFVRASGNIRKSSHLVRLVRDR